MKKEDRRYWLETRLYWAREAIAEYSDLVKEKPEDNEARSLLEDAEKKLKKLQQSWKRSFGDCRWSAA